jgi:hypothetical protein
MKTPEIYWYKDIWWKADIGLVRQVFGGFMGVL